MIPRDLRQVATERVWVRVNCVHLVCWTKFAA